MEEPVAGGRGGVFGEARAEQAAPVDLKALHAKIGALTLEAIYRRPNTSRPAPWHRIYPYLLRGLAITRPNQVWTMDITYIPMARGFVYLAAVVDWFSRRVLAWKLSIPMETDFCIETRKKKLLDRTSVQIE